MTNIFQFSPDYVDTATFRSIFADYTNRSTITTDPRFSGKVVSNGHGEDRYGSITWALPGNYTRISGGFRYATNVLSIYSQYTPGGIAIAGFSDGGVAQLGIFLNSVGGITVAYLGWGDIHVFDGYFMPIANAVAISAPGIVNHLVTNHIGWDITFDSGTGGVVNIWVNGVKVIDNVTGLRTTANGNSYVNQFCVFNGGNTIIGEFDCFWRDLYLNSNTGTENNGYVGPAIVSTLFMAATGHDTDFLAAGSGSPASPLAAIQDSIPDGDVTYIYGTALNQKFTFKPQNVPAAAQSILALQVNHWIKNAGGSPVQITTLLSNGTTDLPGVQKPIPASYGLVFDTFETNATGGAITLSDFTTLEVGLQITSVT